MQIAKISKGGNLLPAAMAVVSLAVIVSFDLAIVDAAHAASKKAKHARPPHAHATSAPSAAQPAPPGPPDPGVYK